MPTPLQASRDTFILGMSRIAQFWGFPRAMGAIYGAIYISPEPVSLDELVDLSGVTKGAVSTNVRALERLGMVHRVVRLGERRDFYTAETDFWKIVKGILREREKSEFDQALRSVDESLKLLEAEELTPEDARLAVFYGERLRSMSAFFRSLDNLVALLLSLEDLRLNTLQRWLKKKK
jgi:DNA-binding transcriptional regulator GbsR (MarR family)